MLSEHSLLFLRVCRFTAATTTTTTTTTTSTTTTAIHGPFTGFRPNSQVT